VHANKAVQNAVEQNKVGGEVITGVDILGRRGRLYYDRGETLLRSRGDFLMGETISRDTGVDQLVVHATYTTTIITPLGKLFEERLDKLKY